MESVAKDLLYALRVLRRNPGFTAAVALSLGLGIGANTAIFTLLDAALWRMLPIRDAEHLLVVGRQEGTEVGTGFNYSNYRCCATRAPLPTSKATPPHLSTSASTARRSRAFRASSFRAGTFALLGRAARRSAVRLALTTTACQTAIP